MKKNLYTLFGTLICILFLFSGITFAGTVEYINVKDYGANGGDTSDDTSTINSAIAALTGGKVLYFPPGTYYISSSLNSLPDNSSVIMNADATLKQDPSAGGVFFLRPGNNCLLQVNLDGSEDVGGGGSYGIYSTSSSPKSGVVIYNSSFKNISTPIRGDGIQFWRIVNNRFYNSIGCAILCGAGTSSPVKYNIFKGNYMEKCGDYAIALYPIDNGCEISYNTMIGNTAKDTQLSTNGYAFGIESASAYGYTKYNKIIGNTVEQTSDYSLHSAGGVVLGDYSEYCAVIGNVLKGNFTSQAIGVRLAISRYCNVLDNTIHKFSGGGVDASSATSTIIKGNNIVDCGSISAYACITITHADNTLVSNNMITHTGDYSGSALSIYANNTTAKSNITISNNEIYNYKGYGIVVQSTSGNSISNLDVKGNSFKTSTSNTAPIILGYINNGTVEGNSLRSLSNSSITCTNSTGVKVYNNPGFATRNNGSDTIASASTTKVINHGLAVTPSAKHIRIIGTSNPANNVGTIWISNISSTQFTVNVKTSPGGSGWSFDWDVDVY